MSPSCAVEQQPVDASASVAGPGLYQINITLPATGLQNGQNSVVCAYGGASTPTGYIIVQIPQ
jgi:uncharacterized protein (TIGR03437 family)